MERPYVVCHMLTSLDGKIDGSFFSAPECGPALAEYGNIRTFYGCQATLYGTTTMKGGYSDGLARKLQRASAHIPRAHVIEVLTKKVSEDYLFYLREHHVSYLFAGKEQLDCGQILQKLPQMFEIEKLMVAGGGMINGSFLQEGLLDELSLVIAPVADGSTTAVSIFERVHFLPQKAPVSFTLKEVKEIEGGSLWLRYLKK